ncbi:LamG-like jellyroll fold domain-containing protein [Chondromyces crocatus]|uniref:LamG-like jellyroll fold domain-containing protein n=1 Tax=Chondromyces crocatus TaxID=52 RepID=A0A0K1EGU8_CHOCO|nr:LamG-like jellyroll fold domain-containing protein [Chondromyces crocatus]AKT40080.1 uncharacterized protein CMC5_042330 [Chondromyces crocatus]
MTRTAWLLTTTLTGTFGLIALLGACGPFQFDPWDDQETLASGAPDGQGGHGQGGDDTGTGAGGNIQACTPDQSRPCYSGPAGTQNVGRCHPGVTRCGSMGHWGQCIGEVVPTLETSDTAELVDDDCRGTLLADDGVLVRYLINDTDKLNALATLTDSASSPLDLEIARTDKLSFTATFPQVGLRWSTTKDPARAFQLIQGTKVEQALHQTTTVTLEMVLRIEDAKKNARLFYLGPVSGGGGVDQLTLLLEDKTKLRFYLNNKLATHWVLDFPKAKRVVLHLVMDTSLVTASERWQLFRDGQLVGGVVPDSAPAQGTLLDIPPMSYLMLGNTPPKGGCSPKGNIHYAAVYTRALSTPEVEFNARILQRDDDTHVRAQHAGEGDDAENAAAARDDSEVNEE